MKKMMRVFLLILFAFVLLPLAGCGNNDTATSSETVKCDHSFEAGETVKPTKNSEGYTLYKCTKCGTTEKRSKVRSYYAEAQYGLEKVIEKLKSQLKDPDSLQYNGDCYSYDFNELGYDNGLFIYKVNYNAKNSFGGYVGYKDVYYSWNSTFNSVGTSSYDLYTKYKLNYYFSF